MSRTPALSISPYAAMKGYPIVYSNPSTGLTANTVNYLKSSKNIIIIGGTGVVGQNTVSQLSGKSITRISGSNRYLTSYEIAKKYSSEFSSDIMLATGENFPDALAGGVLAAKLRTPLILTQRTSIPIETMNFIRNRNPLNIYALGGDDVVADSLVKGIIA